MGAYEAFYPGRAVLFPRLDDCVAETNPMRVADVFVDDLDLGQLGFVGVVSAETGRPPTILAPRNG